MAMAKAQSSFMSSQALLILLLVLLLVWQTASVCCGRERTLAMVKPDGVRSDRTESIRALILSSGFLISREKTVVLDVKTAETFYSEHMEKPFFQELIGFMTSGPIVAMILEHDDAVAKWRSLIGPTDPARARHNHPKSIRALFGSSVTRNCVHGSDSVLTAERELGILFNDDPPTGAMHPDHVIVERNTGRQAKGDDDDERMVNHDEL